MSAACPCLATGPSLVKLANLAKHGGSRRLWPTAPGDAAEGAEATPAAAEDEVPAWEVAVDIVDFTYDPNPVEIPVSGTITWTNQDPDCHTATARNRDVLQPGTLEQGERYSQTFDEAGTFDYFCEFHASMKGTVIVG